MHSAHAVLSGVDSIPFAQEMKGEKTFVEPLSLPSTIKN